MSMIEGYSSGNTVNLRYTKLKTFMFTDQPLACHAQIFVFTSEHIR